MVFTKTSNPWWFIDDTPANVTAALKSEGVQRQNVWITQSNTAGNVFCIVWKGV